MDEGVFIIVALVINHERLARTVNGLVDEMAVLTEALKIREGLRCRLNRPT